MSTVVYGPPFVVEAATPQAPPYSLVATLKALGLYHEDAADPHWQNGVTVWPWPSGTPDATVPCAAGTSRVKEDGTPVDIPIFGPITPYFADACSTISVHDQETYVERATVAIRATESMPVERQLVSGFFAPTNPFVGDLNVSLLNNGDPTDGQSSLALLENAIGASGKQGIIHAPPAVVSAWDASGFTLVEEPSGFLRTKRGTPVVVGDGYIGQHPASVGAPGDTEEWAWATGLVSAWANPEPFMIPATMREALDRETNFVVYRAEKTFVVEWDTELQAAVLVDWSA